MKLWELYRIDPNPQGYDEAYGFIVQAESEEIARTLANDQHGDEGDVWLNPKQSSCVELTADGPQGVIIRDFHAG